MIIVTHAEKCGCGILTQGWLPNVLKVFSAVVDLGAYYNPKFSFGYIGDLNTKLAGDWKS